MSTTWKRALLEASRLLDLHHAGGAAFALGKGEAQHAVLELAGRLGGDVPLDG